MTNPSPITLQQLVRYLKPGLPHQAAAIAELEEDIRANGYEAAMRRDRPWFATWSQDGKQPEPPLAPPQPPAPRVSNPLEGFPWFSQLNPSDGPGGPRQCQTSSIAMALAYLRTPNIRDDTDYLKVVRRHGDTTNQAAHQAALAELGVRGRFSQNCSASEVQAEIRAGRPVCLGILHQGPVGAPSGGGHWIIAYGFDANSWIVNDPYGELDLATGRWLRVGGSAGKGLRYSFRNLGPRWEAEGPRTGWAWRFS